MYAYYFHVRNTFRTPVVALHSNIPTNNGLSWEALVSTLAVGLEARTVQSYTYYHDVVVLIFD